MAEGEGRAREMGPAASSHVFDPVRVTLRMFSAGVTVGGMMGGATPTQRIVAPLVVGSMFAFLGYTFCNFKCTDVDGTIVPCRELVYRKDRLAEEQAQRQADAQAAARHKPQCPCRCPCFETLNHH